MTKLRKSLPVAVLLVFALPCIALVGAANHKSKPVQVSTTAGPTSTTVAPTTTSTSTTTSTTMTPTTTTSTTLPPTTTTTAPPPPPTTQPPATTVPVVTVPATAPPAPASSAGVWDQLAQCESGGNWAINTGNGFYGGLQFTLQSWQGVGGTGYPHQASRETQIAMGERLRAAQGWGAWPGCARKLGLR